MVPAPIEPTAEQLSPQAGSAEHPPGERPVPEDGADPATLQREASRLRLQESLLEAEPAHLEPMDPGGKPP